MTNELTPEEDKIIIAAFNRRGGHQGWEEEAIDDLQNHVIKDRPVSGVARRLEEIQAERVNTTIDTPTEDPTDPLDKITTLNTVLEAVEELSMKIDRQTVVMSALLEELTTRMPKPE